MGGNLFPYAAVEKAGYPANIPILLDDTDQLSQSIYILGERNGMSVAGAIELVFG